MSYNSNILLKSKQEKEVSFMLDYSDVSPDKYSELQQASENAKMECAEWA